jgi:hypothetical protein
MRKTIVLAVVLLLFSSLTLADSNYLLFRSYLQISWGDLDDLHSDFRLAVSDLENPPSSLGAFHEYLDQTQNLQDLQASLLPLITYAKIKPLISSDMLDKFKSMLLEDINRTQELLDRQIKKYEYKKKFRYSEEKLSKHKIWKIIPELQANRIKIKQQLEDFKKHLQKT